MAALNVGGLAERAQLPPIAGTCSGRAIVVASAACVWDDLASLGIDHIRENGNFDWGVIAVNDMIMHFPGRVDHAYSNQYRWMPHWMGARRETIAGMHVKQRWGQIEHTHSCGGGCRWRWPWPGHGTSTLNAVYTALGLGYEQVVICGAPLDNTPHYFEPPWARSRFESEVSIDVKGELQYWASANRKVFAGRVFSQSGRTRELLGPWAPR